jgi:hypothetical protein
MLSAISVPPDGSADFLYLHEIGFSSSMKRKAAGDDDKISGFDMPRVSCRDDGVPDHVID